MISNLCHCVFRDLTALQCQHLAHRAQGLYKMAKPQVLRIMVVHHCRLILSSSYHHPRSIITPHTAYADDLSLWTTEHVQKWLRDKLLPSSIVTGFATHEITGALILRHITDADLQEMGIAYGLHRKAALSALQELLNEHGCLPLCGERRS